jgi:hypothetical protein
LSYGRRRGRLPPSARRRSEAARPKPLLAPVTSAPEEEVPQRLPAGAAPTTEPPRPARRSVGAMGAGVPWAFDHEAQVERGKERHREHEQRRRASASRASRAAAGAPSAIRRSSSTAMASSCASVRDGRRTVIIASCASRLTSPARAGLRHATSCSCMTLGDIPLGNDSEPWVRSLLGATGPPVGGPGAA